MKKKLEKSSKSKEFSKPKKRFFNSTIGIPDSLRQRTSVFLRIFKGFSCYFFKGFSKILRILLKMEGFSGKFVIFKGFSALFFRIFDGAFKKKKVF